MSENSIEGLGGKASVRNAFHFGRSANRQDGQEGEPPNSYGSNATRLAIGPHLRRNSPESRQIEWAKHCAYRWILNLAVSNERNGADTANELNFAAGELYRSSMS